MFNIKLLARQHFVFQGLFHDCDLFFLQSELRVDLRDDLGSHNIDLVPESTANTLEVLPLHTFARIGGKESAIRLLNRYLIGPPYFYVQWGVMREPIPYALLRGSCRIPHVPFWGACHTPHFPSRGLAALCMVR
jgi:hypothetical protein